MGARRASRWPWALVVAGAGAGVAAAAGSAPTARTSIVVFAPPATPQAAPGELGGSTYGGAIALPSGAFVTERRDVEVGDDGEIWLRGVPDTTDPASVQLRGIGEPIAVRAQRFVPEATAGNDVLGKHVGEPVTVVTPKGELAGTLRGADLQSLVLETADGLHVLRRDGYVQDVRLAKGAAGAAALAFHVDKRGKQSIEIAYRADSITWSADYVAVLDAAGAAVDFAAWASIKNGTTASWDGAELTLVGASAARDRKQGAARFTVPAATRLGAGETVQVELAPPRTGVKVRPIVTFEAMPDPAAQFQQTQATDCNMNNQEDTGRAHVALELDAPQLPAGRVHLFQRSAARLDAVGDDDLHQAAGVVRLRVAETVDVTGERHAVSCNYDESSKTIREKVELVLENRGKQRVTVIAREFMWRWPAWRLDGESQKGERVAPQAQEYRVELAPGAKQTVSYGILYAW